MNMEDYSSRNAEVSAPAGSNLLVNQGTSAVPSTSKKVTPPPKSRTQQSINNNTYKNPHLIVEKSVVNELLLVCSVIGSTVDPNTQKIVPVEDCINWLQDLQRALRRDEDAYRPISLLLGQWKVVEQKLIPLVLSCRYNTPLILTIVKILVILTKPMNESSIKAARVLIDTKKSDADQNVIREQIALRENALDQSKLLMEYKRLFVTHPSHHNKKAFNSTSTDPKEQGGLLSIFVSLLAEPLSRTGVQRSANDHLTIELILHLFRNLLSAGGEKFDSADSSKVHLDSMLHQELICLFEKEMVLEILLVIGQEMENRENKQYNLLVMEILHHMLKNEDPTIVARSVIEPSNANKALFSNSASLVKPSAVVGSLTSKLLKEKQKLKDASSSRHSHFGGTLVMLKPDGSKKIASANMNTSSSRGTIVSQQQQSAACSSKKKTKNQTYFVGGSGSSTAIHTRPGAAKISSIQNGPASRKSQKVLHRFCVLFMKQCYGPVMKSLKNEFRRESSRLEGDDKVIFFRIIWFFSQWWRTSCKEGSMTAINSNDSENNTTNIDPAKSSIGQLIFTMDVFTFNLVLSSTDFFTEHKQFKNLSQAVALYVEMMHLLHLMYKSDDSTEHLMAMGLMDRLFYQQDPIDRLPSLLSKWEHGTFTRDYLCDLLELTHVTLKLLETNSKACESFRGDNLNKKPRKDTQSKDAITRMMTFAADFDVTVYLARKIITSKTISMFTQVLSQYDVNALNINDHVIAFFNRICKFVIASDNDDELYGDNIDDTLIVKKSTLEPMLYNVHVLTVFNDILNDPDVRKDQSFTGILSFVSTFVRHFARAADKNPMLFVEALFSHQFPHRHVERCNALYISEELKMLVTRDMLLEQTTRELQEDESEDDEAPATAPSDDDDDEDEMEFVEYAESNTNAIVRKSKSRSFRKSSTTDKGTDSILQGNRDDTVEKELDEDENRWNDRRSFIPKRKFNYDDDQEEEVQMKDVAVSEENPTANESETFFSSENAGNDHEQNETGQKRLRVSRLEDSDDDEEEEFHSAKSSVQHTKSRHLLEDSDEE